jgi:hypothetical protein
MLSRNWMAIAVLAVAMPIAAQDQPTGQTPPPTPSAGTVPAPDNGAEPAVTDDQRAPAPALLGGDNSSLSFSSELERSNYLRGGVSVGSTYDDNAANTVTDRVGDVSYSILPNIQLDQARSRLHWTFAYFGGFTANQRLTERNQGSHNLSGSLDYRLSPHVDLRLSDGFLLTTGFLQQFENGIGTPITGPINGPNNTLITPLAKNLNNTGSADLTYQFSADDLIGIGGTAYDSHFRDLAQGSPALLDTSVRTGDAFWNHRFTPRNWTGVTYKFQRLDFSPGGSHTETHSVLLSHTIYLQQRMTLSFFAGPEYSQLDVVTLTSVGNPPVISLVANREHQLSVSGGGSFGWQGEFTSLHLDVNRKVSDGGGVLGAVELTSVGGGIRHQLLKATALNLSAIYGHNQELGVEAAGTTPLTSASGSFGVEQRLASNFMLRLDYGRDYQKGSTVSTLGSINHNRASISISYNFTRPLGR